MSGQFEGEFALKRVLNRHGGRTRFSREVEAIKQLTDPAKSAVHPHIISLIDHSALDNTDDFEKQFLVMPIARGGDLSAPGRLALYKGSVSAVLQVAAQIASALVLLTKLEIIHRDVKPGNILFTGNGRESWLSDFGICLIRESRVTDTPEIVGRFRAFDRPDRGRRTTDVESGRGYLFAGKGHLLHDFWWYSFTLVRD